MTMCNIWVPLLCIAGLSFSCSSGLTEEQEEILGRNAWHAFNFFDLNKDGYITTNDYFDVADSICSLSHTTAGGCGAIRTEFMIWCDVIFPEGKVNVGQYVQRCVQLTASHPGFTSNEDFNTFKLTFDKLDSNKDGVGSPAEIRRFYKLFGYGDSYDIAAIFRSIDENKDGGISRDEYINAGVVYWSNTPGYENLYNPMKKRREE